MSFMVVKSTPVSGCVVVDLVDGFKSSIMDHVHIRDFCRSPENFGGFNSCLCPRLQITCRGCK